MKRYIIAVILSVILPMAVMAQSSMTDDQVMKFIVKEHNAGSSQSQIVTKLMQNGVDIKTVSGMLGHFSAGFTLDTYAHVTTSAQKEAAQTMGNVLSM